jgi:hypothetical protein
LLFFSFLIKTCRKEATSFSSAVVSTAHRNDRLQSISKSVGKATSVTLMERALSIDVEYAVYSALHQSIQRSAIIG